MLAPQIYRIYTPLDVREVRGATEVSSAANRRGGGRAGYNTTSFLRLCLLETATLSTESLSIICTKWSGNLYRCGTVVQYHELRGGASAYGGARTYWRKGGR